MENAHYITSNDCETYFSVNILERGWIYDVYLILAHDLKNNYEDYEIEKIPAEYAEKKNIDGETFSVFEVYHQIDEPTDFMVCFFIYTINNITYRTNSICFTVENEK